MIKVSLLADVFVGANYAMERIIFMILVVWASLAGQLPMWITGLLLFVFSALYLLSVCVVATDDER